MKTHFLIERKISLNTLFKEDYLFIIINLKVIQVDQKLPIQRFAEQVQNLALH